MDQLSNCISSQVNISSGALLEILERFKPITIKKGNFFIKPEAICREMAFINSGYMRVYDLANGKEVTIWIASKGKFITSLSSFVFDNPGYWYIQAVTDCELLTISKKDHEDLCKKHSEWLLFDNKLLANAYALLERNMFTQLHTTAQQRLEILFNEEPDLFNNVPLQYIASMLGITPESLSRLRKNLVKTIS